MTLADAKGRILHRPDPPLPLCRSMTMYDALRKTGASHDQDLQLVRAVLRLVEDYSNLAAGEKLGISEATVRRWRAGAIAVPIRTSTRLTLRDVLARHGKEQGEWQAERQETERDLEPSVEQVISPDELRRYLIRLGPAGEDVARKLDVLKGVRTVITATAPVPDWWYRLLQEVETGLL